MLRSSWNRIWRIPRGQCFANETRKPNANKRDQLSSGGNVRFWHKADIRPLPVDVAFGGKGHLETLTRAFRRHEVRVHFWKWDNFTEKMQ